MEFENGLVAWLKAAEDGDDLVLRVIERQRLAKILLVNDRPVGEVAP
jgi:hypothetical protein